MIKGPPEPPWPADTGANCKRAGWAAYFVLSPVDICPRRGRRCRTTDFIEGWGAAAEHDLLHGDGAGPPLGIINGD